MALSPADRLVPGARNLLTDVAGLQVGNAQDERLKTGVTVVCADAPFVAGVDVMGGAPGTRETDCLAPDKLVDRIDALVLSGGSAFGLSAAGAVADALREQGRGYAVGPVRVPIVPSAILFDRWAGGANDWHGNPWSELGRQALAASAETFELGSVGAGTGATTAQLKGGLGSASLRLPGGGTVAALVAANPNGAAVDADSGHFHAWDAEFASEFGGIGAPPAGRPERLPVSEKLSALESQALGSATTLAIVATDVALTKAGCQRLAVAAQDGMARALRPAHTPIDGDLVFALSTAPGDADIALELRLLLGHAAALCVARAIARAVYLATPAPNDTLPTWTQRYPELAQTQ